MKFAQKHLQSLVGGFLLSLLAAMIPGASVRAQIRSSAEIEAERIYKEMIETYQTLWKKVSAFEQEAQALRGKGLEIDFDPKRFYEGVKADLNEWQQEWAFVKRARGDWADSAAYRFEARIARAAASRLTLYYSWALRDIISARAYDLEHWRQTINKKMNESIKGERKQIEDWYFSAALQGKWLDEERAAKEKALEQKYLSQEKELHNQYVTRYAQLIQEKSTLNCRSWKSVFSVFAHFADGCQLTQR